MTTDNKYRRELRMAIEGESVTYWYLLHSELGVLLLQMHDNGANCDYRFGGNIEMHYRAAVPGVTEGPPKHHHCSWLDCPCWPVHHSALEVEENWEPTFARESSRDDEFHRGIFGRLEVRMREVEAETIGGAA